MAGGEGNEAVTFVEFPLTPGPSPPPAMLLQALCFNGAGEGRNASIRIEECR